jgi:hypothetical protein
MLRADVFVKSRCPLGTSGKRLWSDSRRSRCAGWRSLFAGCSIKALGSKLWGSSSEAEVTLKQALLGPSKPLTTSALALRESPMNW